jgi:segregation and condensation protein B
MRQKRKNKGRAAAARDVVETAAETPPDADAEDAGPEAAEADAVVAEAAVDDTPVIESEAEAEAPVGDEAVEVAAEAEAEVPVGDEDAAAVEAVEGSEPTEAVDAEAAAASDEPADGEIAERDGDGEGEDAAGEGDDDAGGVTLTAASLDAPRFKALIEAIVFASDRPVTVQRLRQLTRVTDLRRIQTALDEITAECEGRGIILQSVSGGYMFRTHSAFSHWVQQLIQGRPVRLSRAQLETLAIVAYRQPITRPEIDDIRGVDSGGTLKVLLDRQLVRILGKKEEVGRPLLYGTTKEFLDFFSLGDLRELPTLREYSELSEESRRVVEKMGLGAVPTAAPAAAAGPAAQAEVPGTEAVAEAATEAEAVAETVTETEAEAVAETVTETEAVAETVTETEAEAVAETVTETEAEAVAETETEAVAVAVAETVTETEAVAETVTETEAEAVAETVAETETVSETEAEAVAETVAETEADGEAIADAEAMTEAESPLDHEADSTPVAEDDILADDVVAAADRPHTLAEAAADEAAALPRAGGDSPDDENDTESAA